MARILDYFLQILTFVKCGIVHDNETFFRDVRQKDLFSPHGKNGRIYRTGYETYSNSGRFYQGAQGVLSPFSAPIMLSVATLSFHRIVTGSRHIMCKTAFIDIEDWLFHLLNFRYGLAKDRSFSGFALG